MSTYLQVSKDLVISSYSLVISVPDPFPLFDTQSIDSHSKALGNYVSNLAHTHSFIIFAKIVHLWMIVIVSAEIWAKGHPVTLREVKNEFSRRGQMGACY